MQTPFHKALKKHYKQEQSHIKQRPLTSGDLDCDVVNSGIQQEMLEMDMDYFYTTQK